MVKLLSWTSTKFRGVTKYAASPWYALTVALLAGADMFILAVPTDGLLIVGAMARPKRWILTGLLVATGSSLGGLFIALLIRWLGMGSLPEILEFDPSTLSKFQSSFEDFGVLSLIFFAGGPIPVQPGIIIAALTEMSLAKIFFSIWIGRLAKYLFFGFIATKMPERLSKFWALRDEVTVLTKDLPKT